MENLSTTNQLLSCLDVISARFASETFPDPCLPQMNVLNSHINASTGCIFAHDVNQSSFSNLLLYKVSPPLPPRVHQPVLPARARYCANSNRGFELIQLGCRMDTALVQPTCSTDTARTFTRDGDIMPIQS